MTSSTGEHLHILEIPAHELRLHDWYFEMGTKPTREGIRWRTLAQVQVFGELGGVRDGVLIINQVHVKFVGDDAWYAVLHDEKVLVRGLKNDYHAMHDEKENTTVSETQHKDNERYSREDIEEAVRIADLRSGTQIAEFAEIARSQRLGYIRKTKAGSLTPHDYGKMIRIKHEARTPLLMTSFMKLDEYPHRVFLVVDGYVQDVMTDDDIWIDDKTTPEDDVNG